MSGSGGGRRALAATLALALVVVAAPRHAGATDPKCTALVTDHAEFVSPWAIVGYQLTVVVTNHNGDKYNHYTGWMNGWVVDALDQGGQWWMYGNTSDALFCDRERWISDGMVTYSQPFDALQPDAISPIITKDGFELTLHSWSGAVVAFTNAFCPNDMTMIAYDPHGNLGIMTFIKAAG